MVLPQKRSIDIVLAEDDDGHAELIMSNLREAGVINSIVRVSDGQELLDYVRREGKYTERGPSNSYLILLDIRMPRIDGIEALEILKADPELRKIPVIMLTTADNPQEIQRCYDLRCNAYITKPVGYSDFVECIRELGLFTEVIQIPPGEG